MTELTQPLVLSPEESVAVTDAAPEETTFAELVYAHFAWWHALQAGEATPKLKKAYDRARHAFEERHGEMANAYWCSHVESAVALTHKPARFRFASPVPHFFRESDWATQNAPDIASELHRCDELAVKARAVLTGVRRLICMQLVVASASHLLSLVDARTAHEDPGKTDVALKHEHEALDEIEKYYRDAANGQAQIIYFAGMAAVAVVLTVPTAVWLYVSWQTALAALIAGSIGAVVSVVQRINAGHFELDYDVGRPYAFFLGGLRPLIGAAFAMALAFAFTSTLLQLPVSTSEEHKQRLALLTIGFVAGFSERWAQDTLLASVPSAKPKKSEGTAA